MKVVIYLFEKNIMKQSNKLIKRDGTANYCRKNISKTTVGQLLKNWQRKWAGFLLKKIKATCYENIINKAD